MILAGCQTPIKTSLSLPSRSGQGRENIAKGNELRKGPGEITQQIQSQAKLIELKILIELLLTKSGQDNEM